MNQLRALLPLLPLLPLLLVIALGALLCWGLLAFLGAR